MIFTTLEQAFTYISENLQTLTKTKRPPQVEACKYIAAWIVSKKGDRSVETIKKVLKCFSEEMDSDFVSLKEVLETDIFELGDFDDDDESDRFGLEMKKNYEKLGLDLESDEDEDEDEYEYKYEDEE